MGIFFFSLKLNFILFFIDKIRLLCSDFARVNESPEVYIRIYKGDFKKEEFSAAAVWEIVIDDELFGKG